MDQFDFKDPSAADKNPFVFNKFLEIAASHGLRSATLENIVRNIQMLGERSVSVEPIELNVNEPR